MSMFGTIFKIATPLMVTLGLVLGSTAVRADTLADALAAGYENSGLLEQNRALLRVADEDVAQAVAALMPIVNWSLQASSTYPRTDGFFSAEEVNAS